MQIGQPLPQPAAKTTRVIHAAELSGKTYLETKEDVDAFEGILRTELMAAIKAGQKARVQ